MDDWRTAFREWAAPRLPRAGLAELAAALRRRDPAICRGANVRPTAFDGRGGEVECCCPLAYALWKGLGLVTAAAVQEGLVALHEQCLDAHNASRLRALTYWWDQAEREGYAERAWEELAEEVERFLAGGGSP